MAAMTDTERIANLRGLVQRMTRLLDDDQKLRLARTVSADEYVVLAEVLDPPAVRVTHE